MTLLEIAHWKHFVENYRLTGAVYFNSPDTCRHCAREGNDIATKQMEAFKVYLAVQRLTR